MGLTIVQGWQVSGLTGFTPISLGVEICNVRSEQHLAAEWAARLVVQTVLELVVQMVVLSAVRLVAR